MIQPNTQKIYFAPSSFELHFIFEGRRYYKTLQKDCLVSDYGKYGMMPPAGCGFYLKIPTGDFNMVYQKYIEQKQSILNAVKVGYLKAGGVQLSLF